MKNIILIVITLLIITFPLFRCSIEEKSDIPLKVMTFNIRLNVKSDSLNSWPYRMEKVASVIHFHEADIIGVQEALFDQMNDLSRLLPDYQWIGVGRDDGKTEGEFMAIFYSKERFNVIHDSTFWLSENPDIPGIGWDAACNRVVTFAKFLDQTSDNEFLLFNTHFDHIGQTARLESAKLLRRSISEIAESSNIIVTGDFNSLPTSEVYNILTNDRKKDSNLNLLDARKVSLLPHHGPNFTFTGFQISNLKDNEKLIDYIFVGDSVTVLKHGILSDILDGRFPSDHFPVIAEVILK